jgi:low temperature requirement protein LtrA
MSRLALWLAWLHVAFVLIIFGSAIANPYRADLLPVVVFCIDFPLSLLIEAIAQSLAKTFYNALLLDGTLYVILGSLWYAGIGEAITRFIRTTK